MQQVALDRSRDHAVDGVKFARRSFGEDPEIQTAWFFLHILPLPASHSLVDACLLVLFSSIALVGNGRWWRCFAKCSFRVAEPPEEEKERRYRVFSPCDEYCRLISSKDPSSLGSSHAHLPEGAFI